LPAALALRATLAADLPQLRGNLARVRMICGLPLAQPIA
jgi:hypothetical protein